MADVDVLLYQVFFFTLEVCRGSSASSSALSECESHHTCHYVAAIQHTLIYGGRIVHPITLLHFPATFQALCFTSVCSLVGKRCSMKGRVGSPQCSGAAPWLRGWILGVSRSITSSQDRRCGSRSESTALAIDEWLMRIWYDMCYNVYIYIYGVYLIITD